MAALGVNINGDSSPLLLANTVVQEARANPGIDITYESGDRHKNDINENYGNGDNVDDSSKHKGVQTRKVPIFSVKEILKNPALARLLVLASKKVKAENEKKEQT
jgi:hypothetical protein